jgi:group I intron endonuclease
MYTKQEIKYLKEKKEGIYVIKHRDRSNYPGLVYVGQSSDIYKRWREHLSCGKKSGAKKLSEAFCEHGSENFTFEILEECQLVGTFAEQKWINHCNSIQNGLNLTLNVNSIPPNLKSLGG